MQQEIQTAMAQAIAAKVVAELEGPRRDEILAAGVANALSGYSCKRQFEQAIEHRATATMQRLANSGEFDSQIELAIRAGIADLLLDVPGAVRDTLVAAFFGKDGGYSDMRPGLMLAQLSKRASDREKAAAK
jgi:hypothetical protein